MGVSMGVHYYSVLYKGIYIKVINSKFDSTRHRLGQHPILYSCTINV